MAKDIQYKEAGKGVLTGEVTEAQVKKWKEEHKDGIYGASVRGKIGYFRNPGLDDLNCAYAKLDPAKATAKWKELAEVTWLGGCDELLTNERLFISIMDKVQVAADGEESNLVNL